MITTENIKITTDLPTDNETIVFELNKRGIEPLRWAVTAVSGNDLTINVSYEKE